MNSLSRRLSTVAAATLFAFATSGAPTVRTGARPFSPDLRFDFGLIGDVPYDELQATNLFPNLIEELNAAPLAFVVHDGDIKAGATPCTDEVLQRVYTQFQTFRHPLIYVFGDNEWSDCGKVQTNAFDPMERLQKLRDIFTQGDRSLGRRNLRLERQSDEPRFAAFRENVRWTHGGVIFSGLNVPGDDNHFGTPEFGPRNAANIAWIEDTFAIAAKENLRAVMLIMQANPHFDLAATNRLRRGFNEMLRVIEKETVGFRKPVVLVHGDSHYFRIDQPLLGSRSRRRLENFTRVETFGNPDVHWLRVRVDWRDPNVFQFHPQHVRRNRLKHDR
jgi:hypothetical protein